MDNAIKYNKSNGSVKIKISRYKNFCTVIFNDTGIGINKEKLTSILQPFIQEEEDGYLRKYEGAGLGLTIAHKLTTLMNGTLEVESKVDEGTKVTLRFPLYLDPETE